MVMLAWQREHGAASGYLGFPVLEEGGTWMVATISCKLYDLASYARSRVVYNVWLLETCVCLDHRWLLLIWDSNHNVCMHAL